VCLTLCGTFAGVDKKGVGGRELDDEEQAMTSSHRKAASSAKGRAHVDEDGSRWLETLLRKFHNECSHVLHMEHDMGLLRSLFREEIMSSFNEVTAGAEVSTSPQLAHASITPVPLGKLSRPRLDHFASFLSCCAVGSVPMCSGIEVQAFAKVRIIVVLYLYLK
jgi:hypothetical protein